MVEAQAKAKNVLKKGNLETDPDDGKKLVNGTESKQALGKHFNYGSLTAVIAPLQGSKGWEEYFSRSPLESACLEEAGWCFTQACDTPFLSAPLSDIFG